MNREEQKSLEFWNNIYEKLLVKDRNEIVSDDWMNVFAQWIQSGHTVLDLGCGSGNDTRLFLVQGKKVVACDQSELAIENMKHVFPELQDAVCFHMPGRFPFADNSFDLVCADLSLHYFTEKDTFFILDEIKRILVPKGHVLVRVNSVDDVNHGAGAGEEIEPHLFRTDDGMLKRFFDEKDIQHFFSGFEILFCEKQEMHRYSAVKQVFSLCLEK